MPDRVHPAMDRLQDTARDPTFRTAAIDREIVKLPPSSQSVLAPRKLAMRRSTPGPLPRARS
jgi:hypothetical protein